MAAAVSDADHKAAALYLGPFDLIPALKFDQSYNDNLFYNDHNKKASWVTHINPGFQLELKRHLNSLNLTYALLDSIYANSPQDDFIDHFLNANAHLEFNHRNQLELTSGFSFAHNMRGTALSNGIPIPNFLNEPDQYHTQNHNAVYQFGSDGAPGRIQLQLGYNDYIYDNHPTRTLKWDRNDIQAGGTFFYKVMPKTSLLVEFIHKTVNYPNPSKPRYDSTTMTYLGGVTWKAAGKTTGTIKLGFFDKQFDDRSRQPNNFTGFTWQVGVNWQPLSYSQFNLNVSQAVLEPFLYGNLIDQNLYSLDWKHQWGSKLSSTVSLSSTTSNYPGSIPSRSDDMKAYSIGLDYRMQRWLNLGLSYSYRSLNSTLSRQTSGSFVDYGQNIMMFNLMVSL